MKSLEKEILERVDRTLVEKNGDISKYDKENNLIYFEKPNDYKVLHEYDKNKNVTHTKDSRGYEQWFDYDLRGQLIHYKDSTGYEFWKDYNKCGDEIHYADSSGFEQWYEYNDDDILICKKNSKGFEFKIEYDDDGNSVWREYFNSVDALEESKSQIKNNIKTSLKEQAMQDIMFIDTFSNGDIHAFDRNGFEIYNKLHYIEFIYNTQDDVIHFTEPYVEIYVKRDENNHIIYKKHSTGYEEWTDRISLSECEYQLYTKNSYGYKEFCYYNWQRNIKIKINSRGKESIIFYDSDGIEIDKYVNLNLTFKDFTLNF